MHTDTPFTDESYTKETFSDCDLSHKTISTCEFSYCTFERCTFVSATLHHCKFRGCTFKKCLLSAVEINDTSIDDVIFEESKVIGITWAMQDKTSLNRLYMHFEHCVIDYSYFFDLDLKKIHMTQCQAHEVEFEQVNFAYADFSQTDFLHARFSGTNLSHAKFIGATNYVIDPRTNKLVKAKFSMPDVIGLLIPFQISIEDLIE